ncbi:MAG: NADAR family protein [Flammeovirgaceae bacterium]|nr:NADAR family protein [Flammeovirgaceae bacterium]
MKYNLDWIKSQYESEERVKYLFFWGYRPSKDGQVSKSCFSQWWEEAFEVNNIKYKTAEHWMMAKKAELFQDLKIFEQIIQSQTPGEAKKLGRKVKNFDEQVWLGKRYDIVKEGNLYKFSQHASLKSFLINTNDRVLVEASPVDSIWGIGLSKESKEIENPHTWRGLNLLGFALMEVRDLLR